MFDRIAGSYDRLNHLLSANIDKSWRRKALRGHVGPRTVQALDVACGTGDFAIELVRQGVAQVVGVDISEGMLDRGRRKIEARGLERCISLQSGDCAALGFADGRFDLATVAFGVRNFEAREASLRELLRVLRPGGELIILEFSTPRRFPVKQLYRFYFTHVLPTVGGWISGDKGAYTYLPRSVYAFPQDRAFLDELARAGFTRLHQRRLSLGIASIYYGTKPAAE